MIINCVWYAKRLNTNDYLMHDMGFHNEGNLSIGVIHVSPGFMSKQGFFLMGKFRLLQTPILDQSKYDKRGSLTKRGSLIQGVTFV